MATIYKVHYSGGGRGWCGHKQKKGSPYYLVDGKKTARAYCLDCGEKAGMKGRHVTVEQLINMGVLRGNINTILVQ